VGKDKLPVAVARARVSDTRAVVLPGTSNAVALMAAYRPMLSAGVTVCTEGSSEMRRGTTLSSAQDGLQVSSASLLIIIR
jgi:hypothetical protein